jgi:hypothetical protein
MHDFFNLGDLHNPATPDENVALIDCREWESPRTLSHGEIDRQWMRAQALAEAQSRAWR